ncbi:MAG: VWA domain-containing protein [bacterium]
MKRLLFVTGFIFSLFFLSNCSLNSDDTDNVDDATIPNTPSPANNVVDQSLAVTLTWTSNDAQSYDLYFGALNPPTEKYLSNTSATSTNVVGLLYNTTYYWKVIAKLTNGKTVEGPVWNFTTRPEESGLPGYAMMLHEITPELPAYVNVLFQVLDLDGNGITTLTKNDFTVLENEMPVSPTESAMLVRKKDQLDYSIKTVLMIDNSTSLRDSLAEIKAAAIDLINSITEGQEFAIYCFSSEAILLQDFTNDKTLLQSAINSINVGYATTNLYGAVIEGADRWDDVFYNNRILQGSMILLTDGSDTQASHSLSEALNAIGARRVFTVGLGREIDPTILEALGTAGFYSIADVQQLTDEFEKIQIQIENYANSFYQLQYMSPKRGDNTHSLTVEIIDNPYSGGDAFITGTFSSNGFYSVLPGLYVNVTPNNTDGIDAISLNINETITLIATTFLSANIPSYTWSSANTNFITVTVDESDASKAVIKAVGKKGNSAKVTVIDTANSLTKEITVTIL